MTKLELREKANKLPLKPGVYRMHGADGEIIYIGKAKALKNRVSQYFQDGAHDSKTMAMVSCVDDFDVIIVRTEFEAFLLESSLIKRHKPKYNILLKDDKGYPFIRLPVKDPYPKFSVVNHISEDGASYFGPFGGRGTANAIIDAVSGILRLPTCGRVFPRDLGRERPCLNFHMGRCAGYCRGPEHKGEYDAAIRQAASILGGHFEEASADSEALMLEAAENLEFERAALMRDRRDAILNLGNRQLVTGGFSDTDAAGCAFQGDKGCLCVLHYLDGKLCDKDSIIFTNPLSESPEVVFSALLRQYYLNRKFIPPTLLLASEPDDPDSLLAALSDTAGKRVGMTVPRRGDKRMIAALAESNAHEELLRAASKAEKRLRVLMELQKLLKLPQLPRRIEGYDISNTGGADNVGAMSVFIDSKPVKKEFRNYIIKTVEGQDDYGSMREVLERRLASMTDENMPSLLLIDGGQTHARVADEVFGGNLPVFGMVKDSKHRTRALVSPDGEEISISKTPSVFAFIGRIQEDTHRHAIDFHHKRHAASSKASVLTRIRGVGEKRREELLKRFKSIENIKNATLDELNEAVSRDAALAVYKYFHSEEQK